MIACKNFDEGDNFMSENKISTVHGILMGLLSRVLFDNEYSVSEKVNWMDVCRESYYQSVASLTYFAAINYLPKDEKVSKLWSAISFGNLKKTQRTLEYHAFVHKLLTEEKADYCIIKGCASSFYYPDYSFRSMGDVDFLVREKDMERVSAKLCSLGFEIEKENDCHEVLKKDKMHLEMHRQPAGIPDGKAGDIIRTYLEDIFDKAEKVKLDNYEFVKPSDFHHGLIIILHTYHHLLFEGIGLRHLCDLAVFMNSLSDKEFEEMFRDKLSDVGLWKFTRIMGKVAVKYLKMPCKSWIGDIDDKLCDDVMCDILSGGNFGRKEGDRVFLGKAITDKKKGTVAKSTFFQSLATLNKTARGEFPVLEKLPLLKPFGAVMLATRYLYRSVRGKRRSVSEVLCKVRKRKKLYRRLELFENTK